MGIDGLKSRCLAGMSSFLVVVVENPFPYPPSFWKLPAFFRSRSSLILKANKQFRVEFNSHCFIVALTFFLPPIPPLGILVIALGTTRWSKIISPSQAPYTITSAKCLLPCRETYLQIIGIRVWVSLGCHYPPYYCIVLAIRFPKAFRKDSWFHESYT